MTEDQIEQFAIGCLREPGHTYQHGPGMAPDAEHPERVSYVQVLLLERLRSAVRRLGICEEKSSGVDKVVDAAEVYQLPAPDFRVAHRRTEVIIQGPRNVEQMDRADRIRACYQHCALKWVMKERMTNQTLRERFKLPESKVTIASQIIAATQEAGMIKLDAKAGSSRKFARYLPYWA